MQDSYVSGLRDMLNLRVTIDASIFFYLSNNAKRKIDMEFRKRTRSTIRKIHTMCT